MQRVKFKNYSAPLTLILMFLGTSLLLAAKAVANASATASANPSTSAATNPSTSASTNPSATTPATEKATPTGANATSTSSALPSTKREVFYFHLKGEPNGLDVDNQNGRTPSFFYSALHWPLFHSSAKKPFEPALLKGCHWKNKTQMICDLTPKLLWSNGEKITAADVVRFFEHIQRPESVGLNRELVKNIKKVSAPSALKVLFELHQEEARFQETLTLPFFTALASRDFPTTDKAQNYLTSGPYQIENWENKKSIRLKPNPYFKGGHPQRPPIEFLFVPEDSTALTLYEQNHLDFLRRLPTALIDYYKKTPDFHQEPLSRLDYVAFGPQLATFPELRYHLTHAINYDEWGQLLHARGRPGCFGIAKDLFKGDPCYQAEPLNYERWKQYWKDHTPPTLTLYYSTAGGDDHKRSMEWLQNQWKENLGLQVNVMGKENTLFQKLILETPPEVFRFGVPLSHLSCANGLTNLLASPRRTLPFQSEEVLKLSNQIINTPPSKNTERLCLTFFETIIKQNQMIPLGRISVTFLIKPQWAGWQWNPLNYFDLSQLHQVKVKGQ